MTITLDRSRPFGECFPPMRVREDDDNSPIAFFSQDGFHFDIEGNLLEELLTEKQKQSLARIAKEQAAKRAAREAYEREMGEEAPADVVPAKKPVPRDGVEDGKTDKVDLVAWLRGERSYRWMSVVGAISQEYGKTVHGKAEAKHFLVHEKGLVSEEAAKV